MANVLQWEAHPQRKAASRSLLVSYNGGIIRAVRRRVLVVSWRLCLSTRCCFGSEAASSLLLVVYNGRFVRTVRRRLGRC